MSATERLDHNHRSQRLSPWLAPCVVGLASWVCLLSGLYPSVHWYDTGEWVATPRALSLAHPPGHPLTLLSTHLIQLLPWLDGYARANLASALWLSIASAFTASAMSAFLGARSGWRGALTATLVGLYLPALPFAWLQGVRAEVYASQTALVALILCSWARYLSSKDQRWLLMGGLAVGLQASNHTLLAVAVAVPFSLWLGFALRSRQLETNAVATPSALRAVLYLLGATGLGLSLYLYLPLRGQAGGVEGWGAVYDLNTFWETISASVWRGAVVERSAEVSLLENLPRYAAFMITQMGPVSALIALTISLLATLRWVRDKRWGPPLTLALIWLSVSLTKLTYPFLEVNPDFSGYLAAGAPALCLLLGLSALELGPRLGLLCLVALLIGAGIQPRAHGSAQSVSAEAWSRALTEETPPRGSLWSAHYATHFGLTALRVVEGWRPDLALVFRGHHHTPWARARLRASITPRSLKDVSLLSPRSRLEVEGSLDRVPELRSRARATGLTWAITPWARPSSSEALKLRFATFKRRAGAEAPIDIDTAYAMALYHEAHLVWLRRGPAQLTQDEQEALMRLHLNERDAWISALP